MLVLLAVGIVTFGLGGQRLKCQLGDLCLRVGCGPLDERSVSPPFCPLIDHDILYL